MKIIQDRELIRITKMMQGDHEMRDLAVSLLSKKRFRFNFWTIIVFHFILFELTLMGIIYLFYQFHFGLFWIPVVMLQRSTFDCYHKDLLEQYSRENPYDFTILEQLKSQLEYDVQ